MLNTILQNLNSAIGNEALACWLGSVSYGAEGMSDVYNCGTDPSAVQDTLPAL